MTTWTSGGSPSCAEEAGSMKEDFDDEHGLMKASVTLRCAYADRHALVANIVGNRRPWPKGSPGPVPLASTASIVPVMTPGLASGDELIVYGESLVTINYNTKIVDQFSESIEPTSEFLTLDHRWFRWSPYSGPIGIQVGTGSGADTIVFTDYDPPREEEAPGRQMRGINFVRTDFNQVTVPQEIVDYTGCVNSDTVTWSLLGLTSDPETLLYLPPSITTKVDSSNTRKFDITKKFNYNPNGFNKYFRAATGNFQYIYVAGTTTIFKSYPPAVFAGVLL